MTKTSEQDDTHSKLFREKHKKAFMEYVDYVSLTPKYEAALNAAFDTVYGLGEMPPKPMGDCPLCHQSLTAREYGAAFRTKLLDALTPIYKDCSMAELLNAIINVIEVGEGK